MEFPLNLFFIICVSAVSSANAHYCVWGLCQSWEYCCAENVCCTHPNYNIWITVVIIIGIVVGSVLFGTCLYYNLRRIYLYLQRKYCNINSVSVPSEFESEARAIRIVYE